MFQTIFGSSSDVNWKVEININRDLEVYFPMPIFEEH